MAILKTSKVPGAQVPTIQCQLDCDCGKRHIIVVDLRGVRFGTTLYDERIKGKGIRAPVKTVPYRPSPIA